MQRILRLFAVAAAAAVAACGPTVTLSPVGPTHLFSKPPGEPQPTLTLTCTVAGPGLPATARCDFTTSNALAGSTPYGEGVTITAPATSGTIVFTASSVDKDETTTMTAYLAGVAGTPRGDATVIVHPPVLTVTVGGRLVVVEPSVTRRDDDVLIYRYTIKLLDAASSAPVNDLMRIGFTFGTPVTPAFRSCQSVGAGPTGTMTAPATSPGRRYIVDCAAPSATMVAVFEARDAYPGGTIDLQLFLGSTGAWSPNQNVTGPR